METIKISEAEWHVMTVVWSKGPVPASEVVEVLNERKGWHSRTIRTLLDRLTRKKALKVAPKEKRNFYEALITMEQAMRQESRSFLDRVFGGEPGPMLLHLVGESNLTKADIKQLKEMLSEKEK
ncbi:MAG: transcriptional regulator [Verrucomicrobiales bacterium]|nr:transcriptional regulator [Verrucomicrobiales bacterium]